MKPLLLILLLTFSACASTDSRNVQTVEVCIDVVEKGTEIDNRFSAGDFWFGNGSITKSETVYFLVFSNGKTKEVEREQYYATKVGDKDCWKERKVVPNE